VEVNHDQGGGSSKVRPGHCTAVGLTSTIIPNLSHFLQNESNFLLIQIPVCKDPFFLLGGALYLMKKSAKVLHYFGSDCGMLEFFK
jgi:hypothetical protein